MLYNQHMLTVKSSLRLKIKAMAYLALVILTLAGVLFLFKLLRSLINQMHLGNACEFSVV